VSSDDLHEGGRKGGGLREQIPLLLVVLADQETGIGAVDRN
jgi:hypothetical protein